MLVTCFEAKQFAVLGVADSECHIGVEVYSIPPETGAHTVAYQVRT